MINFDRIIDNIFVGSCPTTPVDVSRLQQAGITAVLNLQTDTDFRTLGIDWPTLEIAYEAAGISPWRFPIIDFDREDLVQLLPDAARSLDDMLGREHRVYVHCTAGMERSPAVVIAYLVWHRGSGLSTALKQVKAARRCRPFEDALQRADEQQRMAGKL